MERLEVKMPEKENALQASAERTEWNLMKI